MTTRTKVLINTTTGETQTVELSPEELTQVNADIATDVVRTQETQQRDAFLAQVAADLSPTAFSQIQTALDQITAERQQIALDIADLGVDQTALQAATTLAAVKPIVADMLQKLNHIANGMDNSRQRETRIIKALGRLAARG